MKRISFFDGRTFSRELLVSLFTCFAFVFLTLNTSCNKNDNSGENNSASMENSEDVLGLDGGLTASLLNAIPNDGQDDTQAIQDAIDQAEANGGGTVWLTGGDYNINPDTSIWLKSNVTLSMATNARLIASPSSNERYYVILGVKIHDARVLGGQIVGERYSHNGTTGEWGMGIGLYECHDIRIKNTRIRDCWGDGIVVGAKGGAPFFAGNASTDITILNVVSNNNRRQGLSIGEVNGVTVDSCDFTNTNGTLPKDGIDIEPDIDTCQNVTITHCVISGNKGNGIEINENQWSVIKYITIQNNKIYDNKWDGGLFQRAGHVTFTNNHIWGNEHDSLEVVNCPNSVFQPNTYHQ